MQKYLQVSSKRNNSLYPNIYLIFFKTHRVDVSNFTSISEHLDYIMSAEFYVTLIIFSAPS